MTSSSAPFESPASSLLAQSGGAAAAALAAEVDVAIIGAGFAGAATAWALTAQAPELRVAVLERADEPGLYASGRSAGMGRQLAEDDATTELTLRGASAMRQHGAGAFWHERGGVLTFDREEHLESYRQRAASFALPCQALTASELGSLGVRAAHGLWVPSDGLIDVQQLLRWLLAEAGARGAALSCGTAVEALRDGQGGAVLETSRGALRARAVVEATGAWAGQLTGRTFSALRRHVYAVPGPRVAAGPVPGPGPAALGADGPFVWHIGKHEVYLRPRADDTWLVSPCDERPGEPGDQTLDADAEPELTRRLTAFAPRWAPEAAPTLLERWSCQRTFAVDRRVVLERDRDRPYLIWAAALGGHGATAACAVGERAASFALAALGRDAPRPR